MVFEKLIFHEIGDFFTFDGYFQPWEHLNRTRHEKISRGSYSQTFRPDEKIIGARQSSKLESPNGDTHRIAVSMLRSGDPGLPWQTRSY